MRPLWKDIIAAVWLGMILPGTVLYGAVIQQKLTAEKSVVIAETVRQPELSIYLRSPEGTISEMDLEDYLTGVVLAEMPASFSPEALKAQSVAARTYACKAFHTGGKHGDGSVCTDSACCQAYLTEEDYLTLGGTPENLEKVRQAVLKTSPMVLVYEGELIEATYFSSSGGTTEAAQAVWGADYPYLRAVSSPGEKAASVSDTLSLTPEQFCTALGIQLTGTPAEWFGTVSWTEGGGVAELEIGGEVYTGVQLRKMLNLRSTAFTVAVTEGQITITTRGYGHRVGMSQYGAEAMAEAGSTYQQILSHYYPGTHLVPAV